MSATMMELRLWSAGLLLLLLLLFVCENLAAPQELTTTKSPLVQNQAQQQVNYSAPLEHSASNSSGPRAGESSNAIIINATSSVHYNGITHDANKEVLDYEDELLASMDFVQTLKLADGKAQIDAMLRKHHNNEELYQFLLELNRQYPEVTRLYSIGNSVEGRKLWAIELSESPGKHEPLKPEFRYIANMHGNEVVGRELLLRLARLLLENYRAAQEEPTSEASKPSGPKFAKKLLRSTRIHLLPTLNPDGYANSVVSCKYEIPSRRGRVNANNVDLNRNFPDVSLGSLKPDAATQAETLAFIEWSLKEPFVLSANLHGGALAVIYPYDNPRNETNARCPDEDVFRQLALAYSKSHKTMSLGEDCYDRCSSYHSEHAFSQGIIAGADWYPMAGGIQDWIYDNTNEFDVTLELGCNQYPPGDTLPGYWDYNKKALVSFIREVHKGIKGMVTDEVGNPLSNVTVRVAGRNHDIRTNSFGEFYRLLLPGTYNISFERHDFKPQMALVQLSHGGMPQIYNVKLIRSADDVASTTPPAQGSQTAASGSEVDHPMHEDNQRPTNEDHSLVVATLVMSVITLAMLILMAAAYAIQKRRFTRSQSVSVELQPRSASTGVSLAAKTGSTSVGAGGSSTNHPL